VGLALTSQDIGVPSLTLHGPQHIDQVLSLYKYFLKFSGMKIQSHSYVDQDFEDSELQIKCFPICKSNPNKDLKKMSKKLKTEEKQKFDSNESSFIYVCNLKTKPGELLINKCIELKVPPGPLLGKLKAGEDVTLPDNRLIKSKDVIGPEEKGPIFIVLELPTIDYINSLNNIEELFQYQDLSNDISKLVSTVVHFSPQEVISDERYQAWISKFNESVTHIVCNEENSTQSFVAANRLQIQLNLIDDYIFPLLNCVRNDSTTHSTNSDKLIFSPALLRYHLRPSNLKGLDNESILSINCETFREEALSNKEFVESLKQFHSQSSILNNEIQEYPEILFMGTGSAMPGKVRNTSAIWVNIDSETSFLLDCGEGTFGQIFRFYGHEYESKLKSLKAIYVSHLHADHHLGMLQLIKKRSLITKDSLLLIIPPAVHKWLESYNTEVEAISHLYRMIPCETFRSNTDEEVLNKIGLTELKTCFVPHCDHSYGVCFTTKNEPKYKIVYSGDTIPSDKLIEMGKNCDLLIHEASMEDELVDEARLKFHSTTSEAIEVGKKMNANFTILTHFSQRYAKIPVFNEKFNDRVGIAFDNMRVRMTDLNKLPKMIPTLKCLFVDHIEELKAKTAHKIKRRELLNQYYGDISHSNRS
jgi:ribonuclease Z